MRARGGVPTAAALALLVLLGMGSPLAGQPAWRNLVLTAGVSVESYRGRLPDITAPIVDSTDRAQAAVGQIGGSGSLVFLANGRDRLSISFDAGLRQFAADGFVVRDYSPRELVGTVDLRYGRSFEGFGDLDISGRARGRRVDDRPPMPLFIEPGYRSVAGSARLRTPSVSGVRFDVEATAEAADYAPPALAPHLDLLDRRLVSVEAGAEWGGWYRLRFFAGLTAASYPRQGSFDPTDPHRRDRAVRAGARWRIDEPLFASVEVEGTLNRSNSNRPEYNAARVTALVAAPLPGELALQLYAVLTGKSYLHRTEFARLVPGEEADRASVLFLSLSRPLTRGLDAALRFGWTRAESEIGDAYFRRFGATVFLHYRVGLR